MVKNENYHSSLKRILRKSNLTHLSPPQSESEWRSFLGLLQKQYEEIELERYTQQRSLEISSKEMSDLLVKLKAQSENEINKQKNRLAGILNSVSKGICVLDLDFKITFANPIAEKIFSMSKVELLGRSIYDLIEGDLTSVESLDSCLKTGKSSGIVPGTPIC